MIWELARTVLLVAVGLCFVTYFVARWRGNTAVQGWLLLVEAGLWVLLGVTDLILGAFLLAVGAALLALLTLWVWWRQMPDCGCQAEEACKES